MPKHAWLVWPWICRQSFCFCLFVCFPVRFLIGYSMTLRVGKRMIGRLGPSEWVDPLTPSWQGGRSPTTKYSISRISHLWRTRHRASSIGQLAPLPRFGVTNKSHSQPTCVRNGVQEDVGPLFPQCVRGHAKTLSCVDWRKRKDNWLKVVFNFPECGNPPQGSGSAYTCRALMYPCKGKEKEWKRNKEV